MADVYPGLYWPREKDFNNKNICNKCLKNKTPCCVIDPFYEKGIIKTCSSFKQRKASIIEGVDSYPKGIISGFDFGKIDNPTITICSTPKKKEGDFYEKYIEPWYIDRGFNKENFKEQYIWEEIKKERRNKMEEKNMNKTNSTKINILKNKIEKIKEERKIYIEEIKKIYRLDSCLQWNSYINKKYINYILRNIFPHESDKKIKKSNSYIILDHLNLRNKFPKYYNYNSNNPLSQNTFNLIDARSEDWKLIKGLLGIFSGYAEEYIRLKYEVDLKLISSNDTIICEGCGTINILKSNYCNNCGKEL